MKLHFVINEICLNNQAADKRTAQANMGNFAQLLAATSQKGAELNIRSEVALHSQLLAPDYTIAQWRNDDSVDRDTRSLWRRATTKSPLNAGLTDQQISDLLGVDGNFKGSSAPGFVFTYFYDLILISLNQGNNWNSDTIDLNFQTIEETTPKIVQLKHLSKLSHLSSHQDWLTDRTKIEFANGRDLWNHREQLYPKLIFCENVAAALLGVDNNDVKLWPIHKRLSLLNKYCESWTEPTFNKNRLGCKATTESQGTMEQYGDQRKFKCPDNTIRTFEWHVRLTPHEWRIHFFPLESSKTIIIGYIGEHLDI